jgi:hypothetical protein
MKNDTIVRIGYKNAWLEVKGDDAHIVAGFACVMFLFKGIAAISK